MTDIYQGIFSNWQDVMENFHSLQYGSDQDKANLLEANPEPDKVYFASYVDENYSGDALVAFRKGDKYYTAQGSHCSCYGLEGQWEPEEYPDRDSFLKMVERCVETNDTYSQSPSYNKVSWQLIRKRVLEDNS